METTRLSSKGQLILPKSVRDAHGWDSGVEFVVEDRPEGVMLRPALARFAPTRLEDVIGCTGYKGPAKSLEDMALAIAKGVKEARARGRY